jgi:hypothetical protein
MSNREHSATYQLEGCPELLKPRDVQQLLGITRDRTYALFHTEGFPKVRTGKTAMCVPKARLMEWLGYGGFAR